MRVMSGTRLGPYEIVAPIGAGGMGEVYKALDTRLDRTVAIKVLPAALAVDAVARERFEREARSISSLNHPNICTLHDVGADAGVAYLVMEHLEGEALADRLKKGPLSIEQTLAIALDIAGALDKAHMCGIVHRDLKPGNVMLTKSGAKLLDFGVAKIGVSARSSPNPRAQTEPTLTAVTPLTGEGRLLGTFQYMAPEQIQGQEADERSDIWAFGAMLYEMATGKRAFEGPSPASLMAAILEREPTPLAELQPLTPLSLARVVHTCLAKNPDDRFQSAHDLWLQLQWIRDGGSAAGLAAPVVAHRRRRERVLWIAFVMFAAGAAGAVAWALKPAPAAAQRIGRFSYALPAGQSFTRVGRHVVAISPDGSAVVYVAQQRLFLRRLDQFDAVPIRGTEEDPLDPVFSPDGQWIAYFAPSGERVGTYHLRRVGVGGGAPLTLCANLGIPFGVSWADGLIAFGQRSQTDSSIQTVSEAGGSSKSVLLLKAVDGSVDQPFLFSSGGREFVMFSFLPGLRGANGFTPEERQIAVQPLEGGPRVTITRGANARLIPGGPLVYVDDGTLLGISFDRDRLVVRGASVPLVEGVSETTLSGTGQYAFSADGTLVYVPGTSNGAARRTLTWVDRSGHAEPIGIEPRAFVYPKLSPDGTKIAVSAQDDQQDIWIWDLVRARMTRFTFDPAAEFCPIWTPDGRSIVFDVVDQAHATISIFRKAVDGTGSPARVTKDSPYGRGIESGLPQTISPDGRLLLFRAFEPVAVYAVPLDGTGATRPLLSDSRFVFDDPEISPDGRWLAYQSNESGVLEVYVRPFPNIEGGRWQISTGGGVKPAWSRTGKELFYMPLPTTPGGKMMSTTIQTSPVFDYTKPQPLFDASSYSLGTRGRNYDVAADGRFLFVQTIAQPIATSAASLVIVTHWFDDVRARLK
jgi:hypothetical protein